MTSNRLYAAAALLLATTLSLAACSQADSPEGEAKPKAATTAYPQPAYKVTHEQLRAVTVVGQRLVDNSPSAATEDEAITVGFCDDGYIGAKGRSWFSNDEVLEPAEGLSPGLSGNETTQIGWTFNTTTVLDDSPSAGRVVDERIRGWSSCQPKDDAPLTTQKVALPGAAASVVRTQVAKGLSPWRAHSASGVARVENALVSCTVNARTAKLALGTVTSCLTEMVQAVPLAAEQDVEVTDTNRVVAAKMLLARAAVKGQTVSLRTSGLATTPCETSTKTFLPVGSPAGMLETEVPLEVEDPDTAQIPQFLAIVTAEHAPDAAPAKAKVAAARKTFGGCKGTYSKGTEPYVSTGAITGVSSAAYGDGGFTITHTSQYPGQKKPETVHQSIFSVGPYVVELYGASPKDEAAIAARLKVVAGS